MLRYRSTVGEALPPEFADPGRTPRSDDRDVIEDAFLTRLAQARTKEIERGVCLVGPTATSWT